MSSDAAIWTGYAQYAETATIINLPTHTMELTSFPVVVAGGAHVSLPIDGMATAYFAPTVSGGASVHLPADLMDAFDFAPDITAFESGFDLGFDLGFGGPDPESGEEEE